MNEDIVRLGKYLAPHTKRMCLGIFMTVLFGLCAALPAYLLKPVIDIVLACKQQVLLIPCITIFIGTYYLKGIFLFYSNYHMEYIGHRLVQDLRIALIEQILHLPLRAITNQKKGVLMSHVINDVYAIQDACTRCVRIGIRSFFEALFLIGIAISQNILLAGLILTLAPIIGYTIRYMGKKMRSTTHHAQQQIAGLSANLEEALNGIRDIKAASQEIREVKRFSSALQEYFLSSMDNVRIVARAPAIIEAITMTGVGILLGIAFTHVLNDRMTPGQLAAFFSAIVLAYQPLKRLINVYADIQRGRVSVQRLFSLLDQPLPTPPNTQRPFFGIHNSITFDHVSFAYPDKTPTLRNISFSVARGEHIGIIGPSGSGKSTLADLLLGFLTPTSGTILFDDIPMSSFSIESIRTKIGYVGQQAFLFNDTIAANIAYTKTGATPQEIKTAAVRAGAHEFIQHLPKGYETIVGENGVFLSGGQKQRITIARALIKNPALFIFDEATSALDATTQAVIQQTIATIDTDTIIFVITHRPELLKTMDQVLMIDAKHHFTLAPHHDVVPIL